MRFMISVSGKKKRMMLLPLPLLHGFHPWRIISTATATWQEFQETIHNGVSFKDW